MSRPERLKSSREFKRVFSSGKRASVDALLCVAHVNGDDGPPRFGFVVTKKVGGAVQRNRVKRLLREAVRACSDRVKPGSQVVLMAREPIGNKTLQEVSAAVESAMSKVGVL